MQNVCSGQIENPGTWLHLLSSRATVACSTVGKKFQLGFWVMMGFVLLDARAADKIVVSINHQIISLYHTADLEAATHEAVAGHKPIAWIASAATLLDGRGTISLENSRGATLHAIFALRDRAVLIFEDAYVENHKVLPLVDAALHTPDPHYTPPTVVFLDPTATQVWAKVTYEPGFVKRAHALADALEQVKGKMNIAPDSSKK